MNNLKKVGLTALAGSLALTAAHAGEMHAFVGTRGAPKFRKFCNSFVKFLR